MRKLLTLLPLFFLLAAPCAAQEGSTPVEKSRYAFLRLLARVRENPEEVKAKEALLLFADRMDPKPPIPVEAKKFYVKAMALHLEAVNDTDFDKAVMSYERALEIAPWWGQCYYNMGMALDAGKRFREAEEALRLYALVKPKTPRGRNRPIRRPSQRDLPDFSGSWGSGMDCWRYEFKLKEDELKIEMHCWDFPGTVYGTAYLDGRYFEGSSPGGPSGTGMGVHNPIRFKGTISEDNSRIEISSILAPELAGNEATMNAAMDQVRIFGEPTWNTQTWRRMAAE
ncbi:MAG: tetratricopeptide repeat protein [Elusimicrobiales bacterium]